MHSENRSKWNISCEMAMDIKFCINYYLTLIHQTYKKKMILKLFVVIDETHDLYICNNRMYILTYCKISWTFFFLKMYTVIFALILYQHLCLVNINVNNCLNSTIEHFFNMMQVWNDRPTCLYGHLSVIALRLTCQRVSCLHYELHLGV